MKWGKRRVYLLVLPSPSASGAHHTERRLSDVLIHDLHRDTVPPSYSVASLLLLYHATVSVVENDRVTNRARPHS